MSKPFSYTAAEVANVESALSADRLSAYLASVHDRRCALSLYEWNSTVCAAFYVPLQTVEVGMRNNFDRELSRIFGSSCYDNPKFVALDPRFNRDVREAKDRLHRRGSPLDTPRIVAELHFGFWTTLLARRYEHALWTPALRSAFPRFRVLYRRTPSRNEIARRFDYLREFRNRIAHHEPIFGRDLRADYQSLLEAARWIHADLAEWTDRFCSCPRLITQGPPKAHLKNTRAWCGCVLAGNRSTWPAG